MTMHLAHPALSTGGKRRGKPKFRNSEAAQKARALEASWKELQKKWEVEATDKKRKRALAAEPLTYKLGTPPGRETERIASRGDGMGVATTKPAMQYTGTKMLGIGTMHKSNSVPIFSDEEAIEISRMRR
jgi:hypothetical protein